jgi:hypothetical protein
MGDYKFLKKDSSQCGHMIIIPPLLSLIVITRTGFIYCLMIYLSTITHIGTDLSKLNMHVFNAITCAPH